MFINFLKIAVRNLRRQKAYSLISISGLAVGLAISILTLIWVRHEASYDAFHANIDRLYRVVYTNDKREWSSSNVPGALADFLKETYPEVNEATVYGERKLSLSRGPEGLLATGYFVHPSFFRMFTFPFGRGNPESAFSQPLSIVLSEKMAEKLYGGEDPLGKVVKADQAVDLTVTGIVKRIPGNSTLQFDFLLPYQIAPENMKKFDVWSPHVFVMLRGDSSAEELNGKISRVHVDHNPRERDIIVRLSPFSKTHLHDFLGGGLITSVNLFSAVAFFILLLACINFMNLSTARAETRLKEIGVKKTFGSTRVDVIKQLLGESVFMSFLGLAAAGVLASLSLPVLNRILEERLALHDAGVFLLLVAGIALFTGFVSGIGPALVISSYSPVKILKGSFSPGERSRSSSLRRILVISQYAISVVFIIGVTGVYRQLEFLRNRDLGYQKENVVTLPLKGQLRRNYQALKQELLRIPQVESVTAAANPLIGWWSSSEAAWEGGMSDKKVNLGYNWVDFDYLKTFGLELAEGRFFSPETASDIKEAFVVNEAAVRAMELTDPVGKEIVRSPGTPYEDRGRIIGVVKDFHGESLRGEIRPFCLIPTINGGEMSIRLRPGRQGEVLEKIGKTIRAMSPGHPFAVRFLDKEIDSLYRTDRLAGRLMLIITATALFLSSLGLFGLASFSSRRRTKEIGIRKVIGASAAQIALLLSREYAVLVCAANIIAWPVSWIIIQKWLRNFAYHAEPRLWMFLAAGGMMVLTVVITVARTAVKTATRNPVLSLRHE
jgi:putative ABC transport system permease protein